MRSTALLTVLLLSACASPRVISGLRTPFPGEGSLEINCATFENQEEVDLNKKLARLYEGGWRLATSGHVGSDLFLCFERPVLAAPAEPPPPRIVRPKPRPPPPPPKPAEPPPSDSSASPSDTGSSAAPSDSAKPASDDNGAPDAGTSDDSSSDKPRHKPVSTPDDG